MGKLIQEWGLAAFGALAALASSIVLVRAGRRDRTEDKHEKTAKRTDKIAVEIRHTQKHTNTPPFYDGDL